MGHWNYRLLLRDEPAADPYIELVECYYDDDGNPDGWCEASVGGANVTEIRRVLTLMRKATNQIVLTEADISA